MSDLGSKFILSHGKHSSTTDFSATPSLTHLMPEKHGFLSPDTVKLKRMPAHPNNNVFVPLRGPIDMSKAIALEQIVRGLSGNVGAAIVSASTTDIANVLDVVMGTAGTDPAGAATTATAGTGSTPTLTVTEQARFPVGSVCMFTTSAGTFVRQVRSRAGSSGSGDLTLDRTYTGTVTNPNTPIRCTRWVCDPAIYEHTHMFFRGEYDNDRRDFKGGMSRWSLDFSVGQYGRLMTSWLFTDVADAAEANPTFSEPTAGSGLVNVNNNFFIGNTAFYATDLKVESDGAVVPRKANSGPQGIQGFTVQKGEDKPRVRISVKLQRGVNTGEIADSTGTPSVNSLQAWGLGLGDPLATFDVAFQVGTVAAAFGYGVAQAAYLQKCDEVIEDGYKRLACEFECSSPSSSSFYPFEFHLG